MGTSNKMSVQVNHPSSSTKSSVETTRRLNFESEPFSLDLVVGVRDFFLVISFLFDTVLLLLFIADFFGGSDSSEEDEEDEEEEDELEEESLEEE